MLAAFNSGERENGIAAMLEGLRICESTGSHKQISLVRAGLAECFALAGDATNARQSVQRSLELQQYGEREGEASAYRALAIAAAKEATPDWSEVDEHMKHSLRLARERGERPNLAIGHFRYAELLRDKGGKADLKRARAELGKAARLFGEMDMPWWQEQARALKAELSRS